MNTETKQKIKEEIKTIIDDIEYEEYKFNQVFHSNVTFQRSYYKFYKIYEKYGKEAYLRYVPRKYRNQELKVLIEEKNFTEIYEHFGIKTLKNLEYTACLANEEVHSNSKFKLFLIRLRKMLSKKFIALPKKTLLSLPEGISNVSVFEE